MFARKFFEKLLDEKPLSTQKWLEKHQIDKEAFKVHILNDEKIESTEDFLKQYGVGKTDIKADELKIVETKHRLRSRTLVIWSLIIPMSIAPFWLMILLSLPAFGKKPYSETMQAAFFAGLVSDFVGLYYVITRDLFPQGSSLSRNASSSKESRQDDKQDHEET